jgi:hypothetical protein
LKKAQTSHHGDAHDIYRASKDTVVFCTDPTQQSTMIIAIGKNQFDISLVGKMISCSHKLNFLTLKSSMAKLLPLAKSKPGFAKHQFRQDSKEFKKLLKLFQDGKIKPKEQPASICSKYVDIFGKFTPTQFRSQFHKARSLAGMTCKYPLPWS